jgi:hypothetical protein
MSLKIQLPDDRTLEIGVRDDDVEDDAIPIADLEDDPDDEPETGGSGASRLLLKVAAIGALGGGGLVVARRLIGRSRSD